MMAEGVPSHYTAGNRSIRPDWVRNPILPPTHRQRHLVGVERILAARFSAEFFTDIDRVTRLLPFRARTDPTQAVESQADSSAADRTATKAY
jgi:hypothetical protein